MLEQFRSPEYYGDLDRRSGGIRDCDPKIFSQSMPMTRSSSLYLRRVSMIEPTMEHVSGRRHRGVPRIFNVWCFHLVPRRLHRHFEPWTRLK